MRPEPLRDPASPHPPTTRAIYAALRREIVTLAADAGRFIAMDGKGSWRDTVFIERL